MPPSIDPGVRRPSRSAHLLHVKPGQTAWSKVAGSLVRLLDPDGPSTLSELALDQARPTRPPLSVDDLALRDYIPLVWPVVEPSTPYLPNWHIDAICEHLTAITAGHIRNLIITMPPRHMKSLTVAVFWPTWEWLVVPHLRWIFSSYAHSLSLRDSSKRIRIIQSPAYKAQWSGIFEVVRCQSQKVENSSTGYWLATSVGGSNTGEGGDRIVCDDPHNVNERESEAIRSATLDWWDNTMTTRLNDPRSGAKVVIQQRVHEKDLAGHLTEKGGYVHLNLPTEYEPRPAISVKYRALPPLTTDPRTSEGELLWPGRFGPNEVAQAKLDLGEYGFAGQHQQRPTPAGGGIFKEEHLKFWNQSTLPAVFDDHIDSWDMSFKELADSDYVVGQYWGRSGANFYLLEQVRDRMSYTRTKETFKAWCVSRPTFTRLVEDKANGPAIMDDLKGTIPGLIAREPYGSKESRAHAVSGLVTAGNVYLPDPHMPGFGWVRDLIAELTGFPFAAHDDQVDAFTQAMLWFKHANAFFEYLRDNARQQAPATPTAGDYPLA